MTIPEFTVLSHFLVHAPVSEHMTLREYTIPKCEYTVNDINGLCCIAPMSYNCYIHAINVIHVME